MVLRCVLLCVELCRQHLLTPLGLILRGGVVTADLSLAWDEAFECTGQSGAWRGCRHAAQILWKGQWYTGRPVRCNVHAEGSSTFCAQRTPHAGRAHTPSSLPSSSVTLQLSVMKHISKFLSSSPKSFPPPALCMAPLALFCLSAKILCRSDMTLLGV